MPATRLHELLPASGAGVARARSGSSSGSAGRARVRPCLCGGALLVLAVGALAGPELVLRDAGSDVVVVVDRSRSMPLDADRVALELVRLLEAAAAPRGPAGCHLLRARGAGGAAAERRGRLRRLLPAGGCGCVGSLGGAGCGGRADSRRAHGPGARGVGRAEPRERMPGARRGGWRPEASPWTSATWPARRFRWIWPSSRWTCPRRWRRASPSSSPRWCWPRGPSPAR